MTAGRAEVEPLTFLRQSELARAIPDADLCLLSSRSRVRHCRRHELIGRRGEPIEGLILVVDGAIRSGTMSEDGKEIGYGVITPGHFWGLVSVLDQAGTVHDVHACIDSTLVVIPTAAIHELLEARPSLYRGFNTLLCYRLRRAYSSVDDYGISSLRQRLARQLCLLYGPDTQGSTRDPIRVTQQELAGLVGATRSRVNKALAHLQHAGVLRVGYGGITVLKHEELQRMRSRERLFYL
jgi:CRP-like cAMP-binding protein